jgi:DNA transposition AAA+ family ATPase
MTDNTFVETSEYERFQEFCDACRQYEYIGLCYGPPGVGKTLSARRYANWDKVEAYSKDNGGAVFGLSEVIGSRVVFYTVSVVNSPKQLKSEIGLLRDKLHAFILEDLYREREARMAEVYRRERAEQDSPLRQGSWYRTDNGAGMRRTEALEQIRAEFKPRFEERPDPTRLIVVDEADRLKMAGLEQLRSIFDQGGIGLVFIGMPGLEKRLARYPQLYSRVGFVHQFRPLAEAETRRVLQQQWRAHGAMPALDEPIADEEAIAAIIRVSGGNFRLLGRLLAQIARIMEFNAPHRVTVEIVEAARESLVVGGA